MATQSSRHFLQGFQLAAHRSRAPVVQKSARPCTAAVGPETLKVFFHEVGSHRSQVVFEQFAKLSCLLLCAISVAQFGGVVASIAGSVATAVPDIVFRLLVLATEVAMSLIQCWRVNRILRNATLNSVARYPMMGGLLAASADTSAILNVREIGPNMQATWMKKVKSTQSAIATLRKAGRKHLNDSRFEWVTK